MLYNNLMITPLRCGFFLLIFLPLLCFAQEQEPCRLSLREVMPESITAGDTITLRGKFGQSQRSKLVVINKGGRNVMQVLSWSDSEIRARAPVDLKTGSYKVGVYCRDPAFGSTVSSGFKQVLVKAGPISAERAEKAARRLKEIAARKTQTGTPATKRSSSEGLTDLEKYLLLSPLLLLALILVLRKAQLSGQRQYEAAPMSSPAVNLPLTSEDSGPKRGTCVGVPFTINQYSDELVTTEIKLDGIPLKNPCEVRIENGVPSEHPDIIKRQVKKLVGLEVRYLDIGFHSDRIAAEVPGKLSDFTVEQGKQITVYLIQIKKLLAQKKVQKR